MEKRFDITKKVDLSYIGDSWKDCYIELSLPSYGEIKKSALAEGTDEEKLERALKQVEDLFIKGYAISEGNKVEIVKEDFINFPIEILTKCIQAISGQIDPK